jgi:hypothetical protein
MECDDFSENICVICRCSIDGDNNNNGSGRNVTTEGRNTLSTVSCSLTYL